MKLSVVTTLFRSAGFIEEFVGRAAAVATQFVNSQPGYKPGTGDFEIILVNDGSPDNSLEVALEFCKRNPELGQRITIVDLTRNFGHHRAMMAGLEHAQGDYVYLIDSDLEEAPELLDSFAKAMEETKSDMVYGVQNSRKGEWFERVSGAIFYRLFNFLTRLNMPPSPLTARLMTRRFVDALLLHREREIFLAGLMHVTGFSQTTVTVHKAFRGDTTYNLRRRFSLLVNSVTSFSNAPLVMIFYIGMLIEVLALVYISYLVFRWSYFETPVAGWTSVMASIWLLGGMIISFLGVIGIYLAKTFGEVKARPGYIVRQIYRNGA